MRHGGELPRWVHLLPSRQRGLGLLSLYQGTWEQWAYGSRQRDSWLGSSAYWPFSVHRRLCAVRTIYTAAQQGSSATQRQEPVKWEPSGYPG